MESREKEKEKTERILATSELTAKFTTTLPRKVRDILGIESSEETLVWISRDSEVLVKRGVITISYL